MKLLLLMLMLLLLLILFSVGLDRPGALNISELFLPFHPFKINVSVRFGGKLDLQCALLAKLYATFQMKIFGDSGLF